MVLIEIFANLFLKPGGLAVRLYTNITSGHILTKLLAGFPLTINVPAYF